MFSNLKLINLTKLLMMLMGLTIVIIIGSSYFIVKKIDLINESWTVYQTDLSEKPRLESALRGAIGYGGMIHNFKNYILRQEKHYMETAEMQLGAAISLLNQYSTLQLNTAEETAIEDILSVFQHYKTNLHLAETLILQGKSIVEVHTALKINDKPAIRGLKLLREEVLSKQEHSSEFNKSRILADLRAAIGYDGMIHKFKDYILNHSISHQHGDDDHLRGEISSQIQTAISLIQQYQKHAINDTEKIALNDINLTLMNYAEQLNKIEPLMAQNKSLKESDRIVKVDDKAALRGLRLLEHEININIAHNSVNVSKAFVTVQNTIRVAEVISISVMFIIIILIILLLQYYVIQPILTLTRNMNALADNQLDTDISVEQTDNEVGQMARAVRVFKQNMISLSKSQKESYQANLDLNEKLAENKALQERSDEQTSIALQMAEQMTDARMVSESAMSEAKKTSLFTSSILNAVRDGIITITAQGIIETFNPGAEDIFGYRSNEILGKNISLLMPEPHKSAHDGYLKRFEDGESTRDQLIPLEQVALRRNGEVFPVEISLNTIKIGNETKITGVVRDITERKNSEEKIAKLAMTDALTGLANRHQYDQRMLEAEQRSKRFNIPFALLMIDLDRFKPVNDTYGHHVGDVLLQKVSESLLNACREVDSVCRIGGDEFAIIANGTDKPEELTILAKRIIQQLSEPLTIEGNTIQIGASIGISLYPGDSIDIETFVKMADTALYSCKESGRNSYKFYQNMPDSEKNL